MAGPHQSEFSNPLINWIDTRLPIFTMMQKEYGRLPDAEELQLLLELRRTGDGHPGDHDRHRHLPGDELPAELRTRVRLRPAHHARRELRLAAPLRAPERRIDVLHRHLHPHLPRHVLRLLQVAARAAVDDRRGDPAAHDGDRVHGLRAALGPDVVLGRHRHHQPVLRLPDRRQADRDLAVGRLQRRQPDAQPVLQPALPAAVRAGRRGVPAHRGAARGRAPTIRSAST